MTSSGQKKDVYGGPEIISSERIEETHVKEWLSNIQEVDWSQFVLPEKKQTCASCVDGIENFARITIDGDEIFLTSGRHDWVQIQQFLTVESPNYIFQLPQEQE